MIFIKSFVLAVLIWSFPVHVFADRADPQEQWVVDNLRAGRTVDFNKKCNTDNLKIPTADDRDPRWMDSCRTVNATVIEKILQLDDRTLWAHGLYLVGARISGALDLQNIEIKRQFILRESILDGDLNLTRSTNSSLLGFSSSYIAGNVDAYEMRSDADFYIQQGSRVGGSLDLRFSRVNGSVGLSHSFFHDINISNVIVAHNLELSSSQINGEVLFSNSKFSQIKMNDSHVYGAVNGSYARIDDGMSFELTSFDAGLVANHAVIGGALTMQGATVKGRLDLEYFHCDIIFMRTRHGRKSSFESVDLSGAEIKGNIEFVGAEVNGFLNLESVHSNNLFLRSEAGTDKTGKATFHDISLRAAHIATTVDLSGADVGGVLNAKGLNVGETIYLNSIDGYDPTYGTIILYGAIVKGDIHISALDIKGDIDASNLYVGEILNIKSTSKKHMTTKNIDLSQSHIGIIEMKDANVEGNIDLHSSQIIRGFFSGKINRIEMPFSSINMDLRFEGNIQYLDLSDASIGGALRIDARKPSWIAAEERCALDLDRTRVAFFSETAGVWPASKKLCIGSLKFAGFGKEGFPSSVEQDIHWWMGLMERDEFQNLSPYYQLAAFYQNAGDRDDADCVRYARHVGERKTLWTNGHYISWTSSAFMAVFIGYGIGKYAIVSITGWIIGLSLFFGLLLYYLAPGVRTASRGLLWCVGASLTKLIPGVEIHKEFTLFFEDRTNLGHDWMSVVFAGLSLFGWLIGAVLIATVVGLGQ